MPRTIALLVALVLTVSPARGQLTVFSDDFLTVTTYDSASLMAPCYGGPQTRYTLFEALQSDIFNERAYSGGGKLTFVNRDGVVTPPILPGRVEICGIGWLGLGLGCPGEPALFQSTVNFTNDFVCAYGGIVFHPWNTKFPIPLGFGTNGADGQPGIALVDDDGDGTTDEQDENLASIPTAVGGGYGNRDGTGFGGGADGAPGDAGVDDDGNGTVDDIGETGWAGTDDGDDRNRNIWWVLLDADVSKSESMYLNIDLGASADNFALREARNLTNPSIEFSNEISPGFYQAGTSYNWVFCSAGTCYGAMLWTGRDISNPNETLGPVISTFHAGPTATGASVGFVKSVDSNQFLRHMSFKGNDNFSETFWVMEGNPLLSWPSPSSDLDGDRDVDGTDFLSFSNCFNGSLNPPQAICPNLQADLDGDDDVDGTDFLTFSNCFNGSLNRPNDLCFPPTLTAVGGLLDCP